jgi:hypothetical protein
MSRFASYFHSADFPDRRIVSPKEDASRPPETLARCSAR